MIYIIITVILLQITEAFTDFYIIQDAKGYGRKWHKTNAIYYTLIMVLVYLLSSNWYLILFMITSRWLIFNTLLNYLRGKKLWYRGEKGIDGYLKKIAIPMWVLSIIVFIISLSLIL